MLMTIKATSFTAGCLSPKGTHANRRIRRPDTCSIWAQGEAAELPKRAKALSRRVLLALLLPLALDRRAAMLGSHRCQSYEMAHTYHKPWQLHCGFFPLYSRATDDRGRP